MAEIELAKITKPTTPASRCDRWIARSRSTAIFSVSSWRSDGTRRLTTSGELVGYPDVDIHGAILRLPGTDVCLELLEYRNIEQTPVDMRNGNVGNGHIAFNVDDLMPFYEKLKALGVEVGVAAGDAHHRAEQGRQSRLSDRSGRLSRRTDRECAGLRKLQTGMTASRNKNVSKFFSVR